MRGQEFKKVVTKRARELGIDLIGFAQAGNLRPESDRLHSWLSRGYDGSMAWIGRNKERRTDPARVLPGVKTIISAGVNYYTPARHENRPGTGKVSRYAWGDDYHPIMEARLKALLEYIVDLDPTIRGKVYADTGPIMEKAWAQRSGVGWQGKHTNLISQEYGSWIFLGEILLSVEIEPDVAETDHCGNCILCIEACPTDAITEPYVLDATLCLSYLTIEHRGEIPDGLKGQFEGWLYGCDICQDVCPWNSGATESTEKRFTPRPGNVERELDVVLNMGDEQFAKEFKGSPVKRAKLSGLKRNAKILNEHHAQIDLGLKDDL